MNLETAAKIVSEMAFSATDYVKDGNAILAEAMRLYLAETGAMEPETETELKVILERSFSDRKALSVSGIDMPDHLMDGNLFRISIDGTEVKGRVRLSPKEIAVEITSPFHGCQAGASLLMLAPVIWTERPETGSEANESGREKAVSLLVDIYYSLLE